MRIGKLRHRLQIQTTAETRDSFGQVAKVWQTDQTRWGMVSPVSGTESVIADQTAARVTHKILIRDYQGITPAHRVRWNDRGTWRVFGIVSAMDTDERRRECVIEAREVV